MGKKAKKKVAKGQKEITMVGLKKKDKSGGRTPLGGTARREDSDRNRFWAEGDAKKLGKKKPIDKTPKHREPWRKGQIKIPQVYRVGGGGERKTPAGEPSSRPKKKNPKKEKERD